MTVLSRTIKSIETALDLAIHLEMRGKAFYENAGAGATDEALRKLFTFLIEQETVHMERYKRLNGDLKKNNSIRTRPINGETGLASDRLPPDQ